MEFDWDLGYILFGRAYDIFLDILPFIDFHTNTFMILTSLALCKMIANCLDDVGGIG
jgi:hypothetical protein